MKSSDIKELISLIEMWNIKRKERDFREYYRKNPMTTNQFGALDSTHQHYVRCLYLEGNITLEHPEECGVD